MSRAVGLQISLTICALWVFTRNSHAVAMNMREGVTDTSQQAQSLHMLGLWVCVIVGIVVFGAMFYSMFAHRRSRHPTAANFHESTFVEIIWTLIPVAILVVMAVPTTKALLEVEDNSNADLTVLITGSQWKWHYKYLDTDINFYSNLATPQQQIDNLEPKGEHYLLEVDKPLVLPTNRKVRLLVTSSDVIHSWWIPDFAVKQDAVPGFVNAAWTRIPTPGMYRGQCAELCGQGHAFMPTQVHAIPEAEFDDWLTKQRLALELASGAAVAARQKTWTMDELYPLGEQVFVKNCATCHQIDGLGKRGKYPALAGSPIATGAIADHINIVMVGKNDTEMQAWAPQLSDLELAAVITYERNAWNNSTGDIVQPITVYSTR